MVVLLKVELDNGAYGVAKSFAVAIYRGSMIARFTFNSTMDHHAKAMHSPSIHLATKPSNELKQKEAGNISRATGD